MEQKELIESAWTEIVESLAAGALVKDQLKTHGISRNAFYAYLAANPAKRAAWDMAREASADALYDEAMDIARSKVDKEYAQHARTHIDTLKWAARIRNPRMYGDKAQLDVNVKTVDLTAIIRDANARLAAAKQNPAIEGQFQRIDNNRGEQDASPMRADRLAIDLAALL